MTRHVFVNALSIGTGGGYTVARELLRHIAIARPDWRLTMVAIEGHPLQSELRDESLPANATLKWAPNSATGLWGRRRYELGDLTSHINASDVDAVLQVNGQVLPGVRPPTLAHFQDPFPFRPEAWESLKERVLAAAKRREHRRALRRAAACGWTSHYLEDLVCGWLGTRPRRSVVYYNGVPESWIERARGELKPLADRPMEMVTVSNVSVYKRQSLVIEALAQLRKTPGLERLEYRIIGACSDDYKAELGRLAERLGVGDAVHVEGRVSDERVGETLERARALPLMSVCESFGIPPIEAMTYGTPVVIADCCALPEVCGDAALACPMDDLDGLVERLRTVLTDETVAERLRRAGAERAERFRWSVIGEQMADALEEIIADPQGSATPAAATAST